MEVNKTLQKLLDDCFAHRYVYMQNMNPEHVEKMLKQAYEAGREDGQSETLRIVKKKDGE